jgi:hypothetical protein
MEQVVLAKALYYEPVCFRAYGQASALPFSSLMGGRIKMFSAR